MRSRRILAVAVPLLVGTLLSASCSTDEPSSASEPEPAATSGGTFPVTVAHKFGETTVPEEPVRVVSVGVTEQAPPQRHSEQRDHAKREDQEQQHARRARAYRRSRSGSVLSDAGRHRRLG